MKNKGEKERVRSFFFSYFSYHFRQSFHEVEIFLERKKPHHIKDPGESRNQKRKADHLQGRMHDESTGRAQGTQTLFTKSLDGSIVYRCNWFRRQTSPYIYI